MPKRSDSRTKDLVDKLVARASAIQSSLATLASQFIESMADSTSQFMGSLAASTSQLMESLAASTRQLMVSLPALTGQISENVITGLVMSATYDLLYGVIKKHMQMELSERNQELEKLLVEIEARQADAERWKEIASVNEQLAGALIKEIEQHVRAQIRAELDRGKTRRRIFAAISWFITLILGGIVGAIIERWWQTSKLFW